MQVRSSDRAVDVADQARKDAVEEAEKQRVDAKAALDQQRKDSAAALLEQTKRADQANKIANDALLVANRPWVGIDGNPHITVVREQKSVQGIFSADLKNFGPSTAMKVVTSFILAFDQTSIRKAQDGLCLQTRGVSSKKWIPPLAPSNTYRMGGYTIFPGNIIPITTGFGFTVFGEKDSIPQAPVPIFCVGCISYDGQFGSSIPLYHTRFCYLQNPSGFVACLMNETN